LAAAGATARGVLQRGAQRGSVTTLIGALILSAGVVSPSRLLAERVPVRYAEGVSRGFLRLRADDGTPLADGELIQHCVGSRVTSRLMFKFRDGSSYEETTVFLQQRQFRLVTEHVVQRGPSFPRSQDMLIDANSGKVTVRYSDGEDDKVESEQLDLPGDVANGMILTLLRNVRPGAAPHSFSYVAATPKPRVVKLVLSTSGRERFSAGQLGVTATHYVVKVDLGGVTGALASLAGKQPPDSHVWIVDGEPPAFVAAEQPFFSGGPLWRVELATLERPRPAGSRP
jgi:hypothetical protein